MKKPQVETFALAAYSGLTIGGRTLKLLERQHTFLPLKLSLQLRSLELGIKGKLLGVPRKGLQLGLQLSQSPRAVDEVGGRNPIDVPFRVAQYRGVGRVLDAQLSLLDLSQDTRLFHCQDVLPNGNATGASGRRAHRCRGAGT